MFWRRWLFILFACEYFTYQLLLYSTQHDILFYGLNPIHTPILQVIFIAHECHIIINDIKLCMILLGILYLMYTSKFVSFICYILITLN